MQKIKLAICTGDMVYQERFVKCLMNHYKEKYELHVFESPFELLAVDCGQYDAFVLGERNLKEVEWAEEKQEKTLILDEENKYLEVYKIVEALELVLGNRGMDWQGRKERVKKIIGIYSFTAPHMQIPFAATLTGIMGEEEKTILVDLQADSGLDLLRSLDDVQLGMEDLMTIAATKNYTRGRLLSAIGHHQPWDYVYPVKNANYLQEVNREVVQDILELLVKELEYEIVIMNLGNEAVGLDEMLALCDTCFFLYPKGDVGIWRERHFRDEMKRRRKEDVFHRIQRIEIPSVFSSDEGWEKVADQWKWGTLGDSLRKLIREDVLVG